MGVGWHSIRTLQVRHGTSTVRVSKKLSRLYVWGAPQVPDDAVSQLLREIGCRELRPDVKEEGARRNHTREFKLPTCPPGPNRPETSGTGNMPRA